MAGKVALFAEKGASIVVQAMSSQKSRLDWARRASCGIPHTQRVMGGGASRVWASFSVMTPTCWPTYTKLLGLRGILSGACPLTQPCNHLPMLTLQGCSSAFISCFHFMLSCHPFNILSIALLHVVPGY